MGEKLLGLCSGVGQLEHAVQQLIPCELIGYAEKDPAPAKVMRHRHPGIPNLGDITEIDWCEWVHATLICAGFPCQDISIAGKGYGIGGKRSGIWKNVAEAVRIIRPRFVFLENVSSIRYKGRGLDVVSGDLAAIGYDLQWTCSRASDVSAPFSRPRWFAVARPARSTAS